MRILPVTSVEITPSAIDRSVTERRSFSAARASSVRFSFLKCLCKKMQIAPQTRMRTNAAQAPSRTYKPKATAQPLGLLLRFVSEWLMLICLYLENSYPFVQHNPALSTDLMLPWLFLPEQERRRGIHSIIFVRGSSVCTFFCATLPGNTGRNAPSIFPPLAICNVHAPNLGTFAAGAHFADNTRSSLKCEHCLNEPLPADFIRAHVATKIDTYSRLPPP